jgi:hypothetical protein
LLLLILLIDGDFVLITEYYMAIANQIVEAYSGKIRLTFEVAIALHSSVTLKAKTYFRVDYAAIEGSGG